MAQQIMSAPSIVTSNGMWEHEALDKTWKRVEERVQLLAGKEDMEIEANLQIKDVMDRLETAQKTDEKSKEKHEWVRRQFSRTLECIQTLGGIVSSGASNVFPPSTVCFNAITIVIQGYQKYRGIYESLAELFGKFFDFFDRLDEYRRGLIDDKLARITCQFLEVFIEICERSIQLRSTRHKISAASSAFFLKDGGMQGHLKKMEDLIKKEQSLVGAQSLKLMHGVDGRGKSIERLLRENMSQRGTDRDDKAKDMITKAWKQNLIKALGFPDDMLARSSTEAGVISEPKAEWTRTMDQYTEKLTADMGRWIEDMPEFKSWADDHELPSTPLLIVEGDAGTGKSCLMTHVHHHLLRMTGGNSDARRSVAYLFLDSNVQKGESKQDILAYVSRCLLWQCATSSESLIKSMSTIYEEKKAFNGPLDWWSDLLLENKERERLTTTFYFLVDGLDAEIRGVVPLLQQLTTKYAKSRIRVCLTTRPETTRTLRDSCKLSLEVVKIQEHNQEDVKNYIISRMDQMSTLQDTKRSAVVEWREKILETLVEKGGGDFFTLTSNLDDISKMHLSEDIREVLENTDKTHVDSIDTQIQALNQELTQKELREVNNIILWVGHGRSWFNLDEMDSILSAHRGVTDAISGLPGSLMSLSEKLKNRYTLFQVSPGSQWVKFRSDEFKTRIADLSKSPSAGTSNMDSISGIHETEIKIVEHFLSQVCPEDLYSRFRFAEFFNQKRHSQEKDHICQDSNNADLKIALICLSIITEPRDDKSVRLHPYALSYFLDHMQAVDLARADKTLKAQMGPLLLRLFTEVGAITSTFCVLPGRMTDVGRYLSLDLPIFLEKRREWLWTSKGAQELLRWLTDSSVVENVTSKAHLDLVKHFASPATSPAGRRFVLLQEAAIYAASLLFQTPEGLATQNIRFATIFLHGYVSNETLWQNTVQTAPPPAGMGETLVEFDEPGTLSLGDLHCIEDWAFKTLNVKEKSSLWESQMAHLTKIMCAGENVPQIALQRASKALELDKNNWRAWYYKAVFGVKDDWEAVDILKKVTQKMERAAKSDPPWLDIEDRRSLLADLFLQLGNRLWSIGKELDLASRYHLKCLEYHDQSYINYADVLFGYGKAKAWTHVMDFLMELTRNDRWTQSVHLFVYELLNWQSFSDTVALAVKSTRRWDVIESLFPRVIKRLEESEPSFDALFIVRYSYGYILNTGGHDEDTAIHLWQKAIDDGQAGRYKYDSVTTDDLYNVVNELAQLYSRRGQDPDSAPESVGELIIRLEMMIKLSKETWRNTIASCCLARLHLTIGQEKEAKHAVLELVRSALEMLSDDDPSNDGSALYLLASVFATMNDEVQTLAAWHLMSYVVVKSPEEITQQPDSNPQAIDPNDEIRQGPVTANAVDQAQTEDPTGRGELDPAEDSQRTAEEEAYGSSVETSGLVRPAMIEDETDQQENGSQDNNAAKVDEVANGHKVPESTDADEHSYRTGHAPGLGRHNFLVSCDECDQVWNAEDDLYTCNNCSGRMLFCSRCMDRLSKGELEKAVCDKSHRLTYIPKWSPCQASGRGNTVMVPVGGESLTLEDWKLQVRSSYITTIR